jgi:hypothetical protein
MTGISSWLGLAFLGLAIASGCSAAAFWVHGLTFEQASMLAVIIFPAVLCLYAFAIWRGGGEQREATARRGWGSEA